MKETFDQFPKSLESIRALFPELLSILEAGREDRWYASLWLEEYRQRFCSVAISENTKETLDRGVVFCILRDGVKHERSTNLLGPENLKAMAQKFREEMESLGPVKAAFVPTSWSQEPLEGLEGQVKRVVEQGPKRGEPIHFSPSKSSTASLPELKTLAQATREDLLARAKAYALERPELGELADIRSVARQEVMTYLFFDREKNMSQTLPVSLLVSVGMTASGQSARAFSGGMGGLELTGFSEQEKTEVAHRTLELSLAKKLTPGRYKVITGPDVTGVIAHEAFGHTQEGDTWMKGRSIAEGLYKSKTPVGNEHASIVNHPNLFSMDDKSFGTNGSYYFDHEGQLARPQMILDRGLLQTPMTDLWSSLGLKVPRSANGKRESWRRPLMARQTNTYFTAGDKTLEEMIGMVDQGYLARWSYGGMEDPKGGSLTAGAAYFEEIKDGKLTGEVYLGPSGGHIELSDPVFTLLERIVAKSRSAHREDVPENCIGGCGKYHKEGVHAGCGGPFILWESVNCG